jgi:hypothetical protein
VRVFVVIRQIGSIRVSRRPRFALQELAPKIKAGKIGTNGFFTSRDIYLKGWSGIDTPDLARSATQVAGGRPSVRYQINPKVRPLAQLASGPSDKRRKSRMVRVWRICRRSNRFPAFPALTVALRESDQCHGPSGKLPL